MWERSGKRVSVHQGLQLPEGRPISGKPEALLKIELASSQNFGKDRDCQINELSRLCRTPARLPRRVLCF
jgi:hypothetical protein